MERVGVDDSFLTWAATASRRCRSSRRLGRPGLTCRPRDIFVEQTVAGVARVAGIADGAAAVVDEGVGELSATPIMCWLRDIDGSVEQFNQTMVVQAPAGVTEADVVVVVEALLDRHAMLRLRAVDDDGGGWSLSVPEAGSVNADDCLQAVECCPMRRWWRRGRG